MALRLRRMRGGDIATDGIATQGNQAILYMRAADIRQVKIDFSECLDPAVTISTVTTTGGLNVGTPSISAGVVTLTITGPSGADYADITANLSTGEKITQRIHARENTPKMIRDYAA